MASLVGIDIDPICQVGSAGQFDCDCQGSVLTSFGVVCITEHRRTTGGARNQPKGVDALHA